MKWDRQYDFELSELDDRDRPWTLAVPGRSVVRMSGDNATFRTYAEAEQAGLEWCDMHGKSTKDLVVASIDIAYHDNIDYEQEVSP